MKMETRFNYSDCNPGILTLHHIFLTRKAVVFVVIIPTEMCLFTILAMNSLNESFWIHHGFNSLQKHGYVFLTK